MKPFDLQEDEQSGVGCEEDPSPRPTLIRDSSVTRSAAGAFSSVAIENDVEGVKEKPKELVENKQGEDFLLGLGKESDETTQLTTYISGSRSGSSWNQCAQSVWNCPSRIRSSIGWNFKITLVLGDDSICKWMYMYFACIFVLMLIPVVTGQGMRTDPRNPHREPMRTRVITAGDPYLVTTLDKSQDGQRYPFLVLIGENYDCNNQSFDNVSESVHVCTLSLDNRKNCGLVLDSSGDEHRLFYPTVDQSMPYCILQQVVNNFTLFSGALTVISNKRTSDDSTWKVVGISAIFISSGLFIFIVIILYIYCCRKACGYWIRVPQDGQPVDGVDRESSADSGTALSTREPSLSGSLA